MRQSRRANAGKTISRRWRPWLWDDRSDIVTTDASEPPHHTGAGEACAASTARATSTMMESREPEQPSPQA